MSTITRNLAPLLALLVLGAVVSTWPSPREAYAQTGQSGPLRVTVVSPVPLPVTGQVGIAGTPFQVVLCASSAFNGGIPPDCFGNQSSMAVPPGQRAVIELVVANCRGNAEFLRVRLATRVSDVPLEDPIHLEREALTAGNHVGTLPGTIYADPGSIIGLKYSSGAAPSPDPSIMICDVAVSGLLIGI